MDLSSVEFRSYAQREKLGESLGNCDVGVITQRKSCLGSVVPSKIYGLMAAGRPVLFVGPAESTVAEIVNRFECGWQIDNGDAAGIVELLKLLANEPFLVEAGGRRARTAFEENYDRPLGVARICSHLGISTEPTCSKALSMTAGGRGC